jgi:hypothetical protein
MPNGDDLTRERYLFLDLAMQNIDGVLTPFAASIRGGITYNVHGLPRSKV